MIFIGASSASKARAVAYQLVVRLISLLGALLRLGWGLLAGRNALVVAAGRRKICRSCLYRDRRTCSVCGCVIKLKTLLATERCPLNLWD
jgi:hypothetical protein